MWHKFFIYFFFFGIAFLANTSLGNEDFIHVKNRVLLDEYGDTIQLNAMNLGGWMLWEGWIFGGGLHSETKIKKNLKKQCPDSLVEELTHGIYENFIQKEDIVKIAKLGFNSIRVPIHYKLFLDNGIGWKLMDKLIGWCKPLNVFIIIDLHAAPGGQNGLFISDPSPQKLWNSKQNQKRTKDIWFNIAQQYKDEKIVAGYDLLNEPNVKKGSKLNEFYRELMDTIRTVDTNHLLILEGNKYAHDFSIFEPNSDENIMYSFHYYPWFIKESNRPKALLKYTEESVRLNAPFWCGEWGQDELEDLKTTAMMLYQQQYNFVGTGFWTWKKASHQKYPALNEFNVSENMRHLLKGKRTKNIKEIILNFLEVIRVENNKSNSEVRRILANMLEANL